VVVVVEIGVRVLEPMADLAAAQHQIKQAEVQHYNLLVPAEATVIRADLVATIQTIEISIWVHRVAAALEARGETAMRRTCVDEIL
jgi:hypothetical protein